MMLVGTLSLGVRLAVAVKDLLVARQYGTSRLLDSFLLALSIPMFVAAVVGGSFAGALIPTYVETREREGWKVAGSLLESFMTTSIAILVLCAALLALIREPLLNLFCVGWSSADIALTRRLFLWLLPLVIFSGLSTIWGSLLNTVERFALPALVPLAAPVVVVPVVVVSSGTEGVRAIAIATVVGYLSEATILGVVVHLRMHSVLFRWKGSSKMLQTIGRQYVPMLAGSTIMSSNVLVDQAFASRAGVGSVAALSYGNKVVSFVVGIASLAVSTIMLPQFSRMVARNDGPAIRRTLSSFSALILGVSVPVSVVLVTFSTPIARLLFQRGAFTSADTLLVGRVQAMYMLQIPMYVCSILIVRFIASVRAGHVLMIGAVVNFALNVVLDWMFSRWMGVSGIALATSIVYFVSFAFLACSARVLLRRRGF